jgi:hypothetical protein
MVLSRLNIQTIVLTVHDINCLFESKPGNGFRSRIIHTGKKNLIKKVNIFNVVSETLVDYLRTKTSNPISVVPGAVYEERAYKQNPPGKTRLVVPGSLDKRRRNYQEVFELALLGNKAMLDLEIVLLGGYTDEYGKNIVEKARDFPAGSCRILFYDTDVVHQDEFDKQMDESHFVYIPSVVRTKICGDIPEVYGLTKSSGNIFDVIKHARPFIVPEQLSVPDALLSSCMKYVSVEDIITFLQTLQKNQDEYADWLDAAKRNSEHYTMERVRERNNLVFKNKVNT